MLHHRQSLQTIFVFLSFLAGTLEGALVFEETNLELDARYFDEEVVAVFPFRNEGTETVVIKDLKSSCGCTVPELEKRQYAPGEGGEIRAVFKFGSREGFQSKRVTVVTDDPAKPVYQLKFSTTIPQWGSVDPKILRWSMGEAASAKEVRLVVSNPDLIKVGDNIENAGKFTVTPVRTEGGLHVYNVTPTTTDVRLTERINFTITAVDGDRQESRQVAFHCLVR